MRKTLALAAVALLTLSAASADAAAQRCRDAKGKFTACGKAGSAVTATTAKCKDGTTWSGKSHQGACARHGGVLTWSK
jgi:uncharacterized protein YggE